MIAVTVKEVPVGQILGIHKKVSEFEVPASKSHFEDRYQDREQLVILGSIDDQPAGYLVGFDRDRDGSFYCWMAGVDPNYRRRGVLSALMDYQEAWARSHGYHGIKVRTINERREMLINLVKRGSCLPAWSSGPTPTTTQLASSTRSSRAAHTLPKFSPKNRA